MWCAIFGEAEQLICFTRSVNQGIKGEDVAVALLEMKNKMPVYTEMSYASHVEHDSFSTVHLLVEGSEGSPSLGSGFEIQNNNLDEHSRKKVTLSSYPADPDYIVNHESGIPLCQNILAEMNGLNRAENSAADNFGTVKLAGQLLFGKNWPTNQNGRLQWGIKTNTMKEKNRQRKLNLKGKLV